MANVDLTTVFYLSVIHLFMITKTLNVFILVIFTCTATGYSQSIPEKEKMLTDVSWIITGDKQAGIGRHNSMNAESKIRFNKDSTWECTDPVLGEQKGGWYLKDAGAIFLTPGNSKKAIKCELIVLTVSQLEFRYKQNTAVRTLSWEAEQE